METKDLLFNVINTLSSPIILLEATEPEYTIIYANEEMQRLLQSPVSQELKLSEDFLTILSSYKKNSNSDNLTLYGATCRFNNLK
jgi:nitrogen-specific signal transduction histidine kinase